MKLLLTAINAKYITPTWQCTVCGPPPSPPSGGRKPAGGRADFWRRPRPGRPPLMARLPLTGRPPQIRLRPFRRDCPGGIHHQPPHGGYPAGNLSAKADVLLFSCYIWNIVYVRELAENCRKIMPEVPIWLGGPEVSYDAEAFLRENPAVDGILCGEGEETFCRLAEYYGQLAEYGGQYGRDAGRYGRHDCQRSGQRSGQRPGQGQAGAARLKEIPGLVYREPDRRREEPGQPEGEESIQVNPPAPLPDLDALPFPYSDSGGL